MIQPNGNAILIDFGIAKEIIPASSSSTNSSANPSFAPYEQIYSGKPNRQPSVDIYSLAASFYYAVTGEKPTPSMERRLDDRPLKSPKEINPNLSEHLNTAIIMGMALEKDDRPQLVSDWLQQLELQPPPVSPKYKKEKVDPTLTVKHPQFPVEKKQKKVLWSWLMGIFLVYGLVGYSLEKSASFGIIVLAVAVALAWAAAMAAAMAGAVAGAIAWAVTWAAVAWASRASGGIRDEDIAQAAIMAVAVALVGAMVGALLIEVLEETSIFDRWKNTSCFDPILGLILFALPGLISSIIFGAFASHDILVGMMYGLLSVVVSSFTFFTSYKLNKNKISYFNTFLIFAGTNLSGLGSGWLLAFLLYPKG
jgi:serine/threonine-protein kinase